MAKSVLVTGVTGQLGKALLTLHPAWHGATRTMLDLSQPDSIHGFFQQHHFDIIINCAAYTAVDQAEQEAECAYQINGHAVAQLAEIAKQQGSVLVHISSDYVFDGCQNRPYNESDATNPLNVYGKSKYIGEAAMQAIAPQGIILRTSWLYSATGKNFLTTMQRLGHERDTLQVVCDQVGTPTSADSLAGAITHSIQHPNFYDCQAEIYHYSNEGVASWYDFACAIVELGRLDCDVVPIESKDYPTLAQRPFYSVLNKTKIKEAFALSIPYWRDVLRAVKFQTNGYLE